MESDAVGSAFELLLEGIAEVLRSTNEAGITAFRSGNPLAAKDAADRASRLGQLERKVIEAQNDWATMVDGGPARTPTTRARQSAARPRPSASRQTYGPRTPRGVLTPIPAYQRPILESLDEVGGSGDIAGVLQRVYDKMKDLLNAHDHECNPSDPDMPKWKNRAQWARNDMVTAGLLSGNSPRGVWEITDQGRQALTRSEV